MAQYDLAILGISNNLEPNKTHTVNSLLEANKLNLTGSLKKSLDIVYQQQTPLKPCKIALLNAKPLRQAKAIVQLSEGNAVLLSSTIWGKEGLLTELNWTTIGDEKQSFNVSHPGQTPTNDISIKHFPLEINNSINFSFNLEVKDSELIFSENDPNTTIVPTGDYQFVIGYTGRHLTEVVEEFNTQLEVMTKLFPSSFSLSISSIKVIASSSIDISLDDYKNLERGFFDIHQGVNSYKITPTTNLNIYANTFRFIQVVSSDAKLSTYISTVRFQAENAAYIPLSISNNNPTQVDVVNNILSISLLSSSNLNAKQEIDLSVYQGTLLKSLLDEINKRLEIINNIIGVDSLVLTSPTNIDYSNLFFNSSPNSSFKLTIAGDAKSLAMNSFVKYGADQSLINYLFNKDHKENSLNNVVTKLLKPVDALGTFLSINRHMTKADFIDLLPLLSSIQVPIVLSAIDRSAFVDYSLLSNDEYDGKKVEFDARFNLQDKFLTLEELEEIHLKIASHASDMSHPSRGKNRIYIAAGADNRVSLMDNVKISSNLNSKRVIYVPYGVTIFDTVVIYDDSPCYLASHLAGLLINYSISKDVSGHLINGFKSIGNAAKLDNFLYSPTFSDEQRQGFRNDGMVYAISNPENINELVLTKVVSTRNDQVTIKDLSLRKVRALDSIKYSIESRLNQFRINFLKSGVQPSKGELLNTIKATLSSIQAKGILNNSKINEIIQSIKVEFGSDSFSWDVNIILPEPITNVFGQSGIIE